MFWGVVFLVAGLLLIWYQPKLTGKPRVKVPQPAFRRAVGLLLAMDGMAAIAGGATAVGAVMFVVAVTYVGIGEAIAARAPRRADSLDHEMGQARGVVFVLGGGFIALVGLLLLVGEIHAT